MTVDFSGASIVDCSYKAMVLLGSPLTDWDFVSEPERWMAQWIKALTVKAHDLSWISGTRLVREPTPATWLMTSPVCLFPQPPHTK